MVESSHDAYEVMVLGGMGVRQYARQRGIAPATTMLYRKCGIAIRVVGVDPDSVLFQRLREEATANPADMARVIQRPGATPDTVQATLEAAMTDLESARRRLSEQLAEIRETVP
jgi:D-alanyl-D-alanine carboxypeptidase